MAIANAADPLKMSILQFNKHPFRLTKTWFQSRTVHSQNVRAHAANAGMQRTVSADNGRQNTDPGQFVTVDRFGSEEVQFIGNSDLLAPLRIK